MPPEKLQDKQPQFVRQRRQLVWPGHLVNPQLHDEDGQHTRTFLLAAPRVHCWVPEAAVNQRRVRVQRDALHCQHEGAAYEHLAPSLCDPGYQHVRHEQASEACAVGKGSIVDDGEGVGQDQCGEGFTLSKGEHADGSEGTATPTAPSVAPATPLSCKKLQSTNKASAKHRPHAVVSTAAIPMAAIPMVWY